MNPRPTDRKSNALPVALPRHLSSHSDHTIMHYNICTRFSLLKLVKYLFFFLLFAIGFITPVNRDYQYIIAIVATALKRLIYKAYLTNMFSQHGISVCAQWPVTVCVVRIFQ